MTIDGIRGPRWANKGKTAINLTLDHATYGEIPFTASPEDPEDHGRAIFNAAMSGTFGPIAPYIEQDNTGV